MDSNDYYYQPQPLAYSYHPGPASGDASSYSPTAPPPPIPMSRGDSSKSYHSTSSSSSNPYPEVPPNPLSEEMSYHDDNGGYNGYSHSYPSGNLKNEDDRWYESQDAFVPDDSQLYYDYRSPENVQQNYTSSPTTSLPPAASPPEDMIPRTEPTSASQPEGHQCLYPQCESKPFKRKADLDRHWEHVHLPSDQKVSYYCDYSKCSRHTEPFHRMDHCRDHLREYHKEDLVRKNGKEDDEWYHNRKVSSKWFRCTKCLHRNQIKDSGWTCPNCNTSCDKRRQKLRAR
ncbi:egg shell [Apiospora sp. TS-2023a]